MLFSTLVPPTTSAAFVKIEVRSASEEAEPAKVTLPPCVVTFTRRPAAEIDLSALHRHGLLRFIALGTRRGIEGVPEELTRLNPKIGLTAYALARTFSTFHAESLRFRLHPWFDRWVKAPSYRLVNHADIVAVRVVASTGFQLGNAEQRVEG